jgi:hypothetical protein
LLTSLDGAGRGSEEFGSGAGTPTPEPTSVPVSE